MTVNERQPKCKWLCHADQCVVNRTVAMWMEFAHDVPDDAGALHVWAIGSQPHLSHLKQDPALDRLKSITRVRQSPRVDDRVGVLQKGSAHLVGNVDVDDAFGLR